MSSAFPLHRRQVRRAVPDHGLDGLRQGRRLGEVAVRRLSRGKQYRDPESGMIRTRSRPLGAQSPIPR
jgi:hypothetical protein